MLNRYIPFVVETERLLLISPPGPEDDEPVANLLSNNESMKHLKAMSKSTTGGWKLADAGTRREFCVGAQSKGCGWFANIYVKPNAQFNVSFELPVLSALQVRISDPENPIDTKDIKANATYVGLGGFRSIDWNNLTGEMGIILRPEYFNQGISTEVHYLMLLYGIEILKLNRITFITAESNIAMSKFLSDVLQCTLEGRLREFFLVEYGTREKGHETGLLYSLISQDWWEKTKSVLEARVRKV